MSNYQDDRTRAINRQIEMDLNRPAEGAIIEAAVDVLHNRLSYELNGEPDGCYWCGSPDHKTSDCHAVPEQESEIEEARRNR